MAAAGVIYQNDGCDIIINVALLYVAVDTQQHVDQKLFKQFCFNMS